MSMKPTAAEYFQRVAGHWDDLRSGYFPDSVREAAIAKAYLPPEAVVVDVGTGTGFLALGLAARFGQVYALDGSRAMLEVAQRNLAGLRNVVYQVADASSLPLDDNSVDGVFANMVLHHCPDPAAVIREMVRVLKPGGRLVITDLDQHEHAWMRSEMADEWLGFGRDQVKNWLREAGLVNVLVAGTDQSCCGTSECDPGVAAEISIFVAAGSRRVAGAQAAVQASYGSLAQGGRSEPCSCADATPGPSIASSEGAAPASACCAPDNAMVHLEAAAGSGGLTWVTGYSSEQLTTIPGEAVDLSLGCGNPTAMASLRPGETVLDIGSGAGIDAFYAARRVGPTGKVIGLDMTPAMIERARRSAEAAGLSAVEFHLGNAEDMPVGDRTVDVVISNCVINLCEDKGRVFEEAYRVLKEGGRLSISDMVSDKPLPLHLRSDAASWAGCVQGALPEQEYLDLLRQAGFTDVQAARSFSGGQVAGTHVYSLSVSARKSPAAGAAESTDVTAAATSTVQAISLASARAGGCCTP